RPPSRRQRARQDAGFLLGAACYGPEDLEFPLGPTVHKPRGSLQSSPPPPQPHRRPPARAGKCVYYPLPVTGEIPRNLMKAIVLSAGQGRGLLRVTPEL